MARTRNAGSSKSSRPARQAPARGSRHHGLRVLDAPKSYRVDSSDDSGMSDEGYDSETLSDDGLSAVGKKPNTSRRFGSRAHSTRLLAEASSLVLQYDAKRRSMPMRPSVRRRLPPAKASRNASPRTGAKRRLGHSGPHSETESLQSHKQRKLSPKHEEVKPQGIIPNWLHPSVTYQAWRDIFLYAASGTDLEGDQSSWLIHAAKTCQAFAEPALAALYRSPTIRTQTKAKKLAALLERSPSETRINYRAKIDSLYLDIEFIPQTAFFPLIHLLPRLRELIIYTKLDQPPYRELDKVVRWTYPGDVFRALLPALHEPKAGTGEEDKPFATALKSWHWSGRLLGGHIPTLRDIARIHESPSFAHLSKLSFANLQTPSLNKPPTKDEELLLQYRLEDDAFIDMLGDAIAPLKHLSHLVFECSTVVQDRLLSLLPRDLAHLELIDCWEVCSEDLSAFLLTHGSNLRTLSLLHNQSLNLEYLTALAEACPLLRELHMDLVYYRHHEVIDDGDPLYDQALLPHQLPTWPSSLRVVNFEHIRGWSVETAEMFLQSLIDRAGDLPHLRHLNIKTVLDIPWQARATMRREWRAKMDNAFLRPYEPPTNSSSPRRLEAAADTTPTRKKKTCDVASPSRRSGRIATNTPTRSSRSVGSSQALRQCSRPLYRDPDTDEDEFDVSENEDEPHRTDESGSPAPEPHTAAEAEPKAVQRLCNTVSVTFDNQKVRELQYSMEDFMTGGLDMSSDDEWDGDFEDDDPVVF